MRQGVEIYAVEFGFRELVLVPGAAPINAEAHLSLHAETGGLEGAIDSFPADNFILNSEIIAETTIQVSSGDTGQIEGAFELNWLQPMAWNFLQIQGKPLLLAQNLTFRGVTSVATLTALGAQASIYYRYVSLTERELAEQFTLRR